MLENGGQLLPQLLRLRQHGQRQPPDRPRDDLRCLRHWVHNYHVDGFRFDLASILSRDRNGELVPNPPRGRDDRRRPAAGRHEDHRRGVGRGRAPTRWASFGSLRWAEWNGRYRDDVRRFWRGDPDMIGRAGHAAGRLERPVPGQRTAAVPQHQLHHLARRLHAQRPGDATTEKHNEANGEGNRDGDNNNYSCNYGVEGPTTPRSRSRRVRLRQIKNMMATLLLSQGVPMLLSGDECRRTQHGNNNAYCQDNPISWFDWRLVKRTRG